MNQAMLYLVKYLLLPLGVAALMYVLVHFQLLLMHKLVDLGLTHQKRTRLNLIAFFSTFVAVIILVILNDWLKAQAG